jgi:endonuclease/exonuclease/phosphatase family metal-dependent hydrolase/2'-5' RNA ligase/uncharacterized protein (UPF0248 family)
MRTSEEIYQRVRWDPRFDPSRFVLGITQRGADPKRIPLPAFVPGGEIPWHRVLFVEADGEVVWDRAAGVDRIDASNAGRALAPRRLRAPFFTALVPHAWDPAGGEWRPAIQREGRDASGASGAHGQGVPAAPLRVLTWNTLWDRYESDRIHTARRRPLLLAALRVARADVIALQEVDATLLAMVLGQGWVRAEYTVSSAARDRAVEDCGVLLLSRRPVLEAAVHMLGPHKSLVAFAVSAAGSAARADAAAVVVATVHLSSDHGQDGTGRRRVEIAQVAEGLAELTGPYVLMGDFNDGGEAPDGPAAALRLQDAWLLARGPEDRTPTFDPTVNTIAAATSLRGRAARLDRILLRPGGQECEHPTGADPGLSIRAAALLGTEPAEPGLYLSDHYGVLAELAVAAAGDGASKVDMGESGTAVPVLDVPPTARTAVAWIAPDELSPAIQELRRAYDPQVRRWPPHVNLLFGFVPEVEFDRALPLLAAAATEVAPFTARLDGVHTFGHRQDATIWLDPAAGFGGDAAWSALHEALQRRFPACGGRAEGFTPHLTLGRSSTPQSVAASCADRLAPATAEVGQLAVLSRRGDEPMRVRAVVALGTGEVREPLPDDEASGSAWPAPDSAERVKREVAAAMLSLRGIVHLVGSRRMGCALPGADLDLVAVLPGAPDIEAVSALVIGADPQVAGLRQVVGARVPGLRWRTSGLSVDLVVVGSGGLDPADAPARRTDLGEAAAVALSAITDADAVLDATAQASDCFAALARQVKAWAKARGLDSAPFGGLPGLAWTVLAALTPAPTLDRAGGSSAHDPHGVEPLRRFFAHWAAWDWRDPVRLAAAPSYGSPASAPVTLLTPSAPFRNCAEHVTRGGRDLLAQELYQAWESIEASIASGSDPWPALLAPPPLHRRHAAWAVVTVSRQAGPSAAFDETLGRVRGRMRALLAAVDDAGVGDAHAWPHAAETGPGVTRYAVGLGRTPPDAARLREVAARWNRALPGVEVAWVRGGDLPTLRAPAWAPANPGRPQPSAP